MSNSIRIGAGLLALAVLFCCGCNTSDSNDAQIRLLNVSQGYGSLDVYAGSTQEESAVTYGTLSSYFGLAAGSYTLAFNVTGVTTSLQSLSESFSEKTFQTFVAYGDTGSFATLEIGEDVSAPASGSAAIELVDAAPDAGAVDVYFTASDTALDDASPTFSNVAGGSISTAGFVNISSGTYRMRVTATGSKTDVRLDVASVVLASASISSVVISDTTGGVLVNAMILPQQGSLTVDNNTQARVRAVSGIGVNAAVDTSVGGISLLSGAAPNTIGNYGLVASGSAAVSLDVGGTAISVPDQNLTAGQDYTLLLWTNAAGGTEASLISEANGLPAGGDSKIRLLNSMSGLGDPLSMTVSYTSEASGIALGDASVFASVADGTTVPISVTDAGTSASVYSSSPSLASQGVYTLFMFGTASSPVGTLQADR